MPLLAPENDAEMVPSNRDSGRRPLCDDRGLREAATTIEQTEDLLREIPGWVTP